MARGSPDVPVNGSGPDGGVVVVLGGAVVGTVDPCSCTVVVVVGATVELGVASVDEVVGTDVVVLDSGGLVVVDDSGGAVVVDSGGAVVVVVGSVVGVVVVLVVVVEHLGFGLVVVVVDVGGGQFPSRWW
ncbi:MAG TPA: hypothetical protein VN636_20035 [Acidimicrobiia bacterium]|nr:hypothetical protein [Acidimicrobiia bacterium]